MVYFESKGRNMFGNKDTNKIENKEQSTDLVKIESKEIIIPEDNQVMVTNGDIVNEVQAVNQTGLVKVKKNKVKKTNKKNEVEEDVIDFSDFVELAKLMDTSVAKLKDEFMLFNIRKLMSRMGKVVVRFNVTDAEFERLFLNSSALEVKEILVSPIYLPACERLVKKYKLENPEVSTIIDFPFGESSFKSKINDLKESARKGVDAITVMIPNMLNSSEMVKIFKKQVKKIGRLYKKGSGIALNASDLSEEQIKRAIKITARTKLSFITFAFGEATLEELKAKINVVNKYKGNKKIYVLANVDRADAVMELFKLKVDKILTPYADAIGQELVERFKVKSVKLV